MINKKENTEQKIIEAAKEIFVHKGYDGARMHEIADAAGINKALLGSKADDSVKYEADFPQDYQEKELAGKIVTYEIKVLEVQHKVPIESDDELCSKLMVKNIAELKERISKQSKDQIENSYKSLARSKVVEILTKDLDFPVPPDMLQDSTNNELNFIINAIIKSLRKKKIKFIFFYSCLFYFMTI